MSDKRIFGGIGRFFENDTILWFIILFLLLFWCCGERESNIGNVGC